QRASVQYHFSLQFSCSSDLRELPSFPTRRSSDLVPQAAYELLNPLGTNPEIVLLHPDGTFTAEVEVREAEGTGAYAIATYPGSRSEEHTSELQSRENLVCRLLLEKKKLKRQHKYS